jgi:hypothetical protein
MKLIRVPSPMQKEDAKRRADEILDAIARGWFGRSRSTLFTAFMAGSSLQRGGAQSCLMDPGSIRTIAAVHFGQHF